MTPDELQAYEQRVVAQTAAPLEAALQRVAQAAIVLYLQFAGGQDNEVPFERRHQFGGLLADLLHSVVPRTARRLLGRLQKALRGGADGPLPASERPVPPEILRMAAEADRLASRHINEAARQARSGQVASFKDLTVVTARAHQAVTSVKRTASVAVVTAASEGARRRARELNWKLVWVPERDACLTCLAYAGRVIGVDGQFPAGLTMGTGKSTVRYPISGPPAHPNCKCQIEPLAPEEVDDPLGMPTALRREAERSVLRGESGSDSKKARLAAADLLLDAGTSLPRTVQKRARANIRSGVFAERPIVKRPARPRRRRR